MRKTKSFRTQNLLDEQKMAAVEKDDKIQNLIESKSLMSEANDDLRRELYLKDSKIASQKEKINEWASLLQLEKKKSRAAIAKLMNDADSVIAEAHSIKAESEGKIAAMGATLDRMQDRQKEVLKQERQLYSTQIATCKCFVYFVFFPMQYSNIFFIPPSYSKTKT